MAFSGPKVSTDAAFDIRRIKLFAETVGMHGNNTPERMTNPAYNLLASELTEILKKIIVDAKRYSIMARHSTVNVEDIDRACQNRTIQTPLGHSLPEEKDYWPIANPRGDDFYIRDDPDIQLPELIGRIHKIPPPLKLHCHWLVDNGAIQPIPENVLIPKAMSDLDLPSTSSEITLTNNDISEALRGGNALSLYRLISQAAPSQETIAIRPYPSATLSMEKQSYLKSVIEACVGTSDPLRVAALRALETDACLQETLSIMADIIRNGVIANVAHCCLSLLIYLVRIIRSLIANRNLNLEPALHQLLPSLLTCCMGYSLCSRPETDNHWVLRDFAAKTLVVLVRNSVDLRKRVVPLLRRVFDSKDSSYAMIYGTIIPLNELTSFGEKQEFSSRFHQLVDECRIQSSSQRDTRDVRSMEAAKLLAMLMKVMEPQMRPIRRLPDAHSQ